MYSFIAATTWAPRPSQLFQAEVNQKKQDSDKPALSEDIFHIITARAALLFQNNRNSYTIIHRLYAHDNFCDFVES